MDPAQLGTVANGAIYDTEAYDRLQDHRERASVEWIDDERYENGNGGQVQMNAWSGGLMGYENVDA